MAHAGKEAVLGIVKLLNLLGFLFCSPVLSNKKHILKPGHDKADKAYLNNRQKRILFKKLFNHYKGNLAGKTIALWGLSFKPETDDMREAPALVVIDKLLKDGATIRVFDPIAMDECKRRIGDSVTYCKNMYDAADGADVFALMTEWRQFRLPSWNVIKKVMNGNVIVDGRNIYDRQEVEEQGFVYTRIGER